MTSRYVAVGAQKLCSKITFFEFFFIRLLGHFSIYIVNADATGFYVEGASAPYEKRRKYPPQHLQNAVSKFD